MDHEIFAEVSFTFVTVISKSIKESLHLVILKKL